jgi:hypothetical protein
MTKLGCLLLFVAPIFLIFAVVPGIYNSDAMGWIRSLQTQLFCGEDEVISSEGYRESYMRPGEQGISFYCFNETTQEKTNVDGQMMLFSGGIFAGTLILGITLMIIGIPNTASKLAQNFATSSGIRSDLVQTTINPPINIHGDVRNMSEADKNKLRQAGLGGIISAVSDRIEQGGFSVGNQGQAKSLTEQLQDLDQAYEKRLISREEYDTMRQRIINGE